MFCLDKDLITHSEFAQKKSLVQELCAILWSIDETRSGSIAVRQLIKYMSRTDIQAYLASQQLHNCSSKHIISVLDPKKTGWWTWMKGICTVSPHCIGVEGAAEANINSGKSHTQFEEAKTSIFAISRAFSGWACWQASIDASEHTGNLTGNFSRGSSVDSLMHQEEISPEKKPSLEQPNHIGSDPTGNDSSNMAYSEHMVRDLDPVNVQEHTTTESQASLMTS